MKKLLVVLMAFAVGLFIITGCAGDACDDYVDLVCEKCGADSETCKQMEEAADASDVECEEDTAQSATDALEALSEDDLNTFCNPGV